MFDEHVSSIVASYLHIDDLPVWAMVSKSSRNAVSSLARYVIVNGYIISPEATMRTRAVHGFIDDGSVFAIVDDVILRTNARCTYEWRGRFIGRPWKKPIVVSCFNDIVDYVYGDVRVWYDAERGCCIILVSEEDETFYQVWCHVEHYSMFF